MYRYPFIFSNELKYRLQRHILFWVSWWVFQGLLYSFSAFTMQVPYVQRLLVSLLEAFLYLAAHMFLAYSLIYFVVPRLLLKGRYLQTVLMVTLLCITTAAIAAFIGMVPIPYVRELVWGADQLPARHINERHFFAALLAGLRGAITIGGMAAAIKLMKYLYLKEQRNLQLQKQNTEAQLQLLKAQVHPHFLFNTLNNIYAHSHAKAPVAAGLVTGLGDMLRYMLYDGAQPLVPLHKELKLLQDYMMLEQVRYGNRLDVNMALPENADDVYIAPLLLLPFVENCFKHGASQLLEQPWITCTITLEGTQMSLKLVNGKASPINGRVKQKGIGISNVRKRLQLLYPQKHLLKITETEEIFIVDLKLTLQKKSGVMDTIPAANQPAYA